MNFGLSQIAQIAVTAHDLARATAFYRDTLGMKLLFQAPTMAFFDCGGIRVALGLSDKPFSSIIYYRVDDIEKAFKALSARGVKFEGPPHVIARLPDRDVWLAEFRDSEGNALALMSEPRSRGSGEDVIDLEGAGP